MKYSTVSYFIFVQLTLVSFINETKIKVLHLSFHRGCINSFAYVAQHLDLELTSVFIHDQEPRWLDGQTTGNAIYNITHDVAKRAWEKHKDFFYSFDYVITSDTAPLARIFLQNGWKRPLIIWVCNRFDYADGSTSRGFPDAAYYDLFRKAAYMQNVKIVSYTPYEHHYARSKGVEIGTLTIKPCTSESPAPAISGIPESIIKEETFFIPPYSNDTTYQVAQKCNSMGIPCYQGRYNGPGDLKKFKGIIHIPYAWSNLALFENWRNGIVYFIPSEQFLFQLKQQRGLFFNDLNHSNVQLSEWYNPEYRSLFVFFDSWQDLKQKTEATNFKVLQNHIRKFSQQFHNETLMQWDSLFKN